MDTTSSNDLLEPLEGVGDPRLKQSEENICGTRQIFASETGSSLGARCWIFVLFQPRFLQAWIASTFLQYLRPCRTAFVERITLDPLLSSQSLVLTGKVFFFCFDS